MSSDGSRRAPALKRARPTGQAEPDPLFAASDRARTAFGLQFWFSGDPLADLDLDSVTENDLGDLSTVFPSEEQLQAFRLVKPDYRLPPLEDRTRAFLADFLLCSSFLEYEERSRRLAGACGLSSPPLGNRAYWRTRCRSVVSLISQMPPSRENPSLPSATSTATPSRSAPPSSASPAVPLIVSIKKLSRSQAGS